MASVHLNSVIRLITLKGNDDYSLVRITTTISASDPTDTSQSTTTENMKSFAAKYKSNEIDGTTVKMDDIKLHVDPSSLTLIPTTSDKVTNGTDTFTIISIKEEKEQDTVALFILQLRK